jgi:hypothetical protein
METMKPLNEIYGPRFFARRYKLHWRAPHVCKAINDVLKPTSVIDVGCATGDLVREWETYKIRSAGLEGDPSCLEHVVSKNIMIFDLRKHLDTNTIRYNLCTCFEVAEHIEPEYASMFAYNLTALSNDILVSIAPPGQGGHYHVNCQPPSYWRYMFESFGYIEVPKIAHKIKEGMEPWRKKDGIRAFYNNLAFFRKL